MSKASEETNPSDEGADLTPLLSTALQAILLTRDYVGDERLPAIDGWEWFEAAKKIAAVIPDDEWTTEFAKRLDLCPICQSATGIKLPREGSAYCEDCGWPHEDFANL